MSPTVSRNRSARKRVRLSTAVVSTAALLVFPLVGTAVATPSQLIRPGIGAAGAELGMTLSQIDARLGAPLSQNTTQDGRVAVRNYSADDIVDVYFDLDTQRVRMVIVSAPGFCTKSGECLRREGDLDKLVNRYGSGMIRFEDVDGSVTYRRLITYNGAKVMTEWVPSEEHHGLVQASILYWPGGLYDSGLGGG